MVRRQPPEAEVYIKKKQNIQELLVDYTASGHRFNFLNSSHIFNSSTLKI